MEKLTAGHKLIQEIGKLREFCIAPEEFQDVRNIDAPRLEGGGTLIKGQGEVDGMRQYVGNRVHALNACCQVRGNLADKDIEVLPRFCAAESYLKQ